jgi:hypothetical protein
MQIFVKTLTGKYYAVVGDVKRASLVVIDLVVPSCPMILNVALVVVALL